MDYENKHREEIVRATQLWECGDITRGNLEYIFPELNEDECIRKDLIKWIEEFPDSIWRGHYTKDVITWLKRQENKKSFGLNEEEKIKNVIRGWIYTQPASFFDNGISKEEILDWLEKKGEQEEPQVYETKDGEIITYSENEGYKVIEPQFHEGDWFVNNNTKDVFLIKSFNNGFCTLEDIKGNIISPCLPPCESESHIWTVADAKNGDVLAYVTDEEDLWIMIYWSLYEPYEGHVHYHALLVNDNFSDKGTCCICINDLKPATKEQHDLLFSKMKEAGYEFNFEKKELKKIEIPEESLCISLDEYNKVVNECWHRNKSKWSEEDDAYKLFTISAVEDYYDKTNPLQKELVNWLKSLKDRVQTKQEWSEADKIRLDRICKTLWKNRKGDTDEIYQQEQDIDWLKFLKPRSCWKPNKDQIIALRWVLNNIPYNKHKEEISGLLDQIKVL